MEQRTLEGRPPPALEVLGTTTWLLHWGGCNNPCGGLEGQLTRCRLGSLVFYVRESVTVVGNFWISSGERRRLKMREYASRHGQFLELCCPPGEWEAVGRLVAAADSLGRPVRRNRNFTYAWATRQFNRAKEPER